MLLRHFALLGLALVGIAHSAPQPAGGDRRRRLGTAPAAETAAPVEATAADTAEAPAPDPEAPLPDRFERWLHEVDPLITSTERVAFSRPPRPPPRRVHPPFWQVRDPYPETGRNELKENWDERVFEAESEYDSLDDDRSRILLVHGSPDATMDVRCTTTRVPVAVWLYNSSDVVSSASCWSSCGRAASGSPPSGARNGVARERDPDGTGRASTAAASTGWSTSCAGWASITS